MAFLYDYGSCGTLTAHSSATCVLPAQSRAPRCLTLTHRLCTLPPVPRSPPKAGSGNHGLDCNCPADTTSTTTVALATTVTFDHATDTFQLTLSGALNRPQRTINTVRLGDSSGGSCFSVPQHYWSCDGSCTCIVTVSLDEYSTTCSPVEADLGDGKTGFTVFATVEGQDTHTTGTFGQTLTTPEVVVLSATASTTVTTRQIVIEAVGINQGITSVRVDSVTIIPRSPNSGDVDAELEIVVTLVTPGDLDGVSAQGTYFNGLSAGVALVTEWPHWWSLCGFDHHRPHLWRPHDWCFL